MHITLRANEKIYLNGAVLKADRKVSLELMNDAIFLLEAHVMREREATTPLRQLYYIVQLMLMSPQEVAGNASMFTQHSGAMLDVYEDASILAGVRKVQDLVGRGRHFEALKVIRAQLPAEDILLGRAEPLALAVAS